MKPMWGRLLLMPLVVLSGGLGISCSATAPGAKNIDIAEVPVAPPKDAAFVTPWVADAADAKWREGKPMFEVDDAKAKVAGHGWVAVSKDYLLMRIVSKDEHHVACFKGTPWTSDGVEVCIDARGDGSRQFAKDKDGTQGPDDAKFILALSTDGPVVMCTNSQNPDSGKPFPDGTLAVTRDEAKKETVYDFKLKWDFLATPPGLYDAIGLSVQFNNQDPGDKDKRTAIWGGNAFGAFKPGLFQHVALAAPAGEYGAIAFGTNILWDGKDAAEAVVAVASKSGTKIGAKLGCEEVAKAIPTTTGLKRFRVTFRPADRSQAAAAYAVELGRSGQEKPMARMTGQLEFAGATYAMLIARCDALLVTAEHPLFRQHLNSVRSLAMTEWARIGLYRDSAPQTANNVHGAFKKMIAGLDGDAGKWQTYLDGKRLLIMAYVSPKDKSIQYYQFGLPKNWDPEKTYPFFLELHGAGDDNPLLGVSGQVSAIEEASPLFGYGSPRSYAGMAGAGYYCEPFGRGNLGYRGIGETDVWEAYDDVHRRFKCDPDRQYLFGFSMGGGGTWSVGVRTPDRWAAMAILAGGMWREGGKVDLGGNLAYMPVFIWAGEKDSLFPNVARFKQTLERHGCKPVVRSTPDLGHSYTGEIQKESFDWLVQHTRKRPDAFSFTADTPEHMGTWGIDMVRDLTMSGAPSFECKIDGQTVRINSEGTPGLTVRPGEGGLGLTGNVKIYWNGDKVYEGSAQEIPNKKKGEKPTKDVKIGEVPDDGGRR